MERVSTIDTSAMFVSVIQMHKGLIYKIANAYCRNVEDRKDLVQDIIMQVWKSFDSYTGGYKYSTWIYRIALNTAISFYRRENRRRQIFHPLTDEIISIADTTDTEEHLGFLQQFISELKELDKALMLLYLEEKSHREIADITGISETNVGTRIGRIKTVLKQKFSGIQTLPA